MQVRTDQRSPGVGVNFQWPEGLRLRRDRIVDDVVWNDAELIENTLRRINVAYMRNTGGIAIMRFAPIELLLPGPTT